MPMQVMYKSIGYHAILYSAQPSTRRGFCQRLRNASKSDILFFFFPGLFRSFCLFHFALDEALLKDLHLAIDLRALHDQVFPLLFKNGDLLRGRVGSKMFNRLKVN